MPLAATDVAAAAEILHRARLTRVPAARLTDQFADLSVGDAYAIQDHGIRLRVAEGERVIGAKLGFTSAAMQSAMGVDSPNYGWLTDAMHIPDGTVRLDALIHPKLEPEIAFVLDRDLHGPDVGVDHVLAATGFVVPALEVVDSRYQGFRFRAPDNTADNSSAGALALGTTPVDPGGLDLARLGAVLTVGGEVRSTAAGAAVGGHPAASVAWLARRLAAHDRGLTAGQVVIAGGLTGPVDLTAGMEITLEVDRLGSVTVRTT